MMQMIFLLPSNPQFCTHRWNEVASSLSIPFDEQQGIHPEFSSYDGTVSPLLTCFIGFTYWGPQLAASFDR